MADDRKITSSDIIDILLENDSFFSEIVQESSYAPETTKDGKLSINDIAISRVSVSDQTSEADTPAIKYISDETYDVKGNVILDTVSNVDLTEVDKEEIIKKVYTQLATSSKTISETITNTLTNIRNEIIEANGYSQTDNASFNTEAVVNEDLEKSEQSDVDKLREDGKYFKEQLGNYFDEVASIFGNIETNSVEVDEDGNEHSKFDLLLTIKNTADAIVSGAKKTYELFTKKGENGEDPVKGAITAVTGVLRTAIDKGAELGEAGITSIVDGYKNTLENINNYYQAAGDVDGGGFSNTLGNIINEITTNATRDYRDGVSETTFGTKMDESWKKFLNDFKSGSTITFFNKTPLDSSSADSSHSYFGSMIMGTPYTFNQYSDPTNRVFINSLVKDAQYITFTPGFPKFNGLSYDHPEDSALTQMKSGKEMLNYLTKNNLDKDFSDKDKRYYTFASDYAAYFGYLETMLNTIWIKLGLANDGSKFNLFTFFKLKNGNGINPSQADELLEQYNSPIGFFGNFAGSISEGVNSQMTSVGSELAARANGNATDYQKINYITGMGTGSAFKNTTRTIGITTKSISQIGTLLGETFQKTSNALGNLTSNEYSGMIPGTIKFALNLVNVITSVASDVIEFSNTQDLGAIIQSFATANGMMVSYPELWSNSSFMKSMNFNFKFISPYGDPLSIFKYVYVPFCSLLCLGMPRQAAENALVSPFLLRCDVPGIISSDLAMISDLTWVRGGSNSLWTKDNLPREIDVSVTVQDLYPYLAMTKRLSFLSANPAFTSFLNSLTGMISTVDDTEGDYLEKYFKAILDKINDQNSADNKLWNKYNKIKSNATSKMIDEIRTSLSATVNIDSTPWMHNASL